MPRVDHRLRRLLCGLTALAALAFAPPLANVCDGLLASMLRLTVRFSHTGRPTESI